MCRILDDRQPCPRRDRQQGVHVGGAPEEMHGYDGPCPSTDLALHVGWIDEVGRGVDVREDRHGAQARDGAGRREERVAREDHLVAGADVERHEREQERVAAGCARDRVGHAEGTGQFVFQIVDVGAEDEPPGVTDAVERGPDFLPQDGILPVEGEQPDRRQEPSRFGAVVGGVGVLRGRAGGRSFGRGANHDGRFSRA